MEIMQLVVSVPGVYPFVCQHVYLPHNTKHAKMGKVVNLQLLKLDGPGNGLSNYPNGPWNLILL